MPAGWAAPTSASATAFPIQNPNGVAADPFGSMYLSTASNCVFRLDPSGNLSRVAGTCQAGYSGDGGSAVAAELNNPQGLAVDALGNLYIADQGNQRIRKVTPAGTINTVAGTGTFGYSGDNGPATSAALENPHAVAVDNAGNLYIADMTNNAIRKVAPNGTITTIAGTGTHGISGDGGPATGATLSDPLAKMQRTAEARTVLTEAVSVNSPYKAKAQETLNKIGGSTKKSTHKAAS